MNRILKTILFLGLSGSLTAQPTLVVEPGQFTFPLAFHTTKPQFIFGDLRSLKVLDWSTAEMTTIPISGMKSVAISKDGRFTVFAGAYNETHQIVIQDETAHATKTIPWAEEIKAVKISGNNKYLLIESETRLRLLSLETYTELGSFKQLLESDNSCAFKDNTLAVFGKDHLQLLGLPDFKLIRKVPVKGKFSKFSSDGQYFFCIHDDGLQISETGTGNAMGKIQASNWLPFPFDNFPAVSPDGKQFALFHNFGIRYVGIYDLKTGDLMSKKKLSNFEGAWASSMYAQIDPTWHYFAVVNKSGGVSLFNLDSGAEMCQIFSTGPKDFFIKIPDGHYMATRQGAAQGIAFEKDGQIFPFEQFDLQFNRPDLVLSYLQRTPPGTIDLLKKAYEKRLKTVGVKQPALSDADFHVPTATVETDLPIFTDETKLSVSVLVEDTKVLLDRLQISVNGVPVFGKGGYSLREKQIKRFRQKMDIQLLAGDNKIELEAFNQSGARSTRAQYIVRCDAPAVKPNLYLVTIGVSKYADQSKNLRFPVEDTKRLTELFRSNNTVYQQVFSENLLEDGFSKSALIRVKQSLLRSKETDYVVVFFAGHGLVDDSLDYYLGSGNVNFEHPALNGIPFESLETLLDGIPARNRLMLVDACFSGEIDKETARQIQMENTTTGPVITRSSNIGLTSGNTVSERAFNLMHEWFVDLRAGTGATILSSASGLQTAAEGEQWQNGVFTWCLLNGLRDRKADKNKDGAVMVSELQEYLAEEVPKQTQGRQQPTFRVENMVNDWRIW